MPLPVGDQACQQVGATKQRRVDGLNAADRDVVAAAGSGVQAVEVELLGGQAAAPGKVVERCGQLALLRPRRHRLHVHLDDAGIGGHDELLEPRVGRRRIPLDHETDAGGRGRLLEDVQQVGVVLEVRDRGEEDVHLTIAGLERDSGGRGGCHTLQRHVRDLGLAKR